MPTPRYTSQARGLGKVVVCSSWITLALVVGCSGSDAGTAGAGGTISVGGAPSSGGSTTLGGTGPIATSVPGTGGIVSVGGSTSTGGAANLGGTSATGGARSTGGAAITGGTTATATGGANATGGALTATGGMLSTGGGQNTGGVLNSGGTAAVGGTKATGGSKSTGGFTSAGGANTGGRSSTGGTAATGGTTSAGGSTGTSGGPGSSTELCTRWNADRADMTETGWTGNVSTCTPGDMSATSRANALRLVNLYRWIAGQPAVTTSDQYNQDDQACALMMAANQTLNHTPPTTWTCYTAAGANAAGSSNISGAGAVVSVAEYMVDPGNATTLGHRRWVLSNSLGPIGIGSTGTYSCMWTVTNSTKTGQTWIAWPPPGFFPLQATSDSFNRNINTTGWSVQSDSINLAGATVTVTLNGANLAVTVAQLAANYGSRYAISFIPSGWTIAAGNTYHVSISGIATPITYDVQVVSC